MKAIYLLLIICGILSCHSPKRKLNKIIYSYEKRKTDTTIVGYAGFYSTSYSYSIDTSQNLYIKRTSRTFSKKIAQRVRGPRYILMISEAKNFNHKTLYKTEILYHNHPPYLMEFEIIAIKGKRIPQNSTSQIIVFEWNKHKLDKTYLQEKYLKSKNSKKLNNKVKIVSNLGKVKIKKNSLLFEAVCTYSEFDSILHKMNIYQNYYLKK